MLSIRQENLEALAGLFSFGIMQHSSAHVFDNTGKTIGTNLLVP